MIVLSKLEKLESNFIDVKIREDNIIGDIPPEKLKQLDVALKKSGLQLMDNEKVFRSKPFLTLTFLFRLMMAVQKY
ncbi:MAG: hypothetical protein JXR41_11930 [Bacteroidales bacterium]|nr:hypothetical protein [Bacteroidales bacterium]